jgi:hypothetical protein
MRPGLTCGKAPLNPSTRLTDATSKDGNGAPSWANPTCGVKMLINTITILELFIGFISLTSRQIAPLPELGNWLLSPFSPHTSSVLRWHAIERINDKNIERRPPSYELKPKLLLNGDG